MPRYRHPGVYRKEVTLPSRPIDLLTIGRVAFIGQSSQGPLGSPQLINSVASYTDTFGEDADDAMGLATRSYFLNHSGPIYVCRIAGGNGQQANSADYIRFLTDVLDKVSDVGIIVLPGQHWPVNGNKNPVIADVLTFCHSRSRFMLIFDLVDAQLVTAAQINAIQLPQSSFGCVYYPWLTVVRKQLGLPSQKSKAQDLIALPSAGFIAGLWSRIAQQYAVWKAPAGVQAVLAGGHGLHHSVSDGLLDTLNSMSLNCLRDLPQTGVVVWGARTLASNRETQWRYISVRRTAILIEQSVLKGTSWVVFEANDQNLWQSVVADVENFLAQLYRAGAFAGNKSSQGYFVKCGLGETMTANDIANQRLIIELGFAPVKPAEFVVLRIEHEMHHKHR